MEPSSQSSSPAPDDLALASTPDAEIASEAGAASEPRDNWFTRAIRPFMRSAEPAAAAAPDEQAADQQSAARETPPWQAPTWATKEEHDAWLERQNRSYADRRDRDRDRRSAQEAAAVLNQQVGELEAKNASALAEDDLYEVGLIEKDIDALKRGAQGDPLDEVVRDLQHAVAGETVAQFDRIIDGLVLRVPERQRASLFPTDEEAAAMTPWDQRAVVAERAIEAIERQADEKAAARARKDPVVRKDVLHEYKALPESAEDEPVHVSAAPNGGGPTDMDAFIRSVRSRR